MLSFLRQINDQKKLVASICRGSLLVAKSGIAKGRHLTGFHLDKEFPDLVTARSSKPAVGFGAMTVPSVVDGNLVSSRHPNDIEHFVGGIRSWLSQQSNSKTNLK